MRVRVPPSAPIDFKPLILLKAVEKQWAGFALATRTRYKTRMSERPKYPHLQQSGPRGIWSFRRVVPVELRSILRKKEIVVSLQTADLEAALPAYHDILLSRELRLKNDGPSIRAIPIHSTLIDMGLLAFVSSQKDRLFPDLSQHASGRFSDSRRLRRDRGRLVRLQIRQSGMAENRTYRSGSHHITSPTSRASGVVKTRKRSKSVTLLQSMNSRLRAANGGIHSWTKLSIPILASPLNRSGRWPVSSPTLQNSHLIRTVVKTP